MCHEFLLRCRISTCVSVRLCNVLFPCETDSQLQWLVVVLTNIYVNTDRIVCYLFTISSRAPNVCELAKYKLIVVCWQISSGISISIRSQAVATADRAVSQKTVYSNYRLLLNSISSCFRDIGLCVLCSRVWPFRVTWSHWSLTIGFPIGHFLLVVLWNQASISNGFRYIQWRIWRNGSMTWPQ